MMLARILLTAFGLAVVLYLQWAVDINHLIEQMTHEELTQTSSHP